MASKVYETAEAALDGLLFDGMLIAAGGFGLCGIPELSIAAIRKAGVVDDGGAGDGADGDADGGADGGVGGEG